MSHLDRLRAKERTSAPASESSTASTPSLISDSDAGSLPPFAVTADYQTCMVALLFDPEVIPQLATHPLFQHEARLLHGAATDCEQWIEEQILNDRDRQIRGVQ